MRISKFILFYCVFYNFKPKNNSMLHCSKLWYHQSFFAHQKQFRKKSCFIQDYRIPHGIVLKKYIIMQTNWRYKGNID